jgi:hypothetical protein
MVQTTPPGGHACQQDKQICPSKHAVSPSTPTSNAHPAPRRTPQHPPADALAITLEPEPAALLSTRHHRRTAVRRGADRTAEGHHSCLARRCPAPGRILYCGAVLIADRPTQRLPGGASGQHPGGRSSSPWSGCLDACLLSIASLCPLLGVHLTRPAVQGRVVQPSGVQPSGVQPSGVRLSGSLVRTRLSGYSVSSPSGVQSSGVCPSARSQPSRPTSAGCWRWGDPRYGAAAVTAGSGRVPGGLVPVPGGWVDGPRRHGCGHRCGGGV